MYSQLLFFNKFKGTVMIYPELQNYLISISSTDTVDIFDKAIEVFDKYDVPDYMTVFDLILGETNDLGSDRILDHLLTNLRTILTHLLTVQGIGVSEETTTSQLTTIADTLFELPYYEDKAILNRIMDSDSSIYEKVGELFSLLTPLTVEDYLPLIIFVDENFISNFKSQLKETDKEVSNLQSINEYVNSYIKFKNILLNNEKSYCDKYLMQLSSIGLPFETYLKEYEADKREYLHDINGDYIDTIAQDLVGLACISSDGFNNQLIVIRQYLSTVYPDIASTTKVDIAVSKLVLKLTQ
jgi:hypothetical protein